MRRFRFTIGTLMGVVLVLAIGFAALKNVNTTWAGVMVLLTCGALGLAMMGAVLRREATRAWWIGFAVFGWGYLGLALWSYSASDLPELPTTILLEAIVPKYRWAPPSHYRGTTFSGCVQGPVDPSPFQIGQCLWTFLVALLGGVLARAVFVSHAGRSVNPQPRAQTAVQRPRMRWFWLMTIAMAAPVVFTSTTAIASRSNPGLWTGATFFLTCGLLGVAILGALFGRGRRREICMGAALFGTGYLLLALGRPSDRWLPLRPRLVTDELVQAVRPWLPVVPKSMIATNARILDALDQPIPMHFVYEITLDDLLKHIKKATSTPSHPTIPIYVDPIGLQEAERSLNSTVQIDLEGVSLKTTLRLCLKQLGLDYSVKDGYLWITIEDAVSSDLEDPLLIVGHCLLALLAAIIGGVAAPLVSDARRERLERGGAADAPAPASSH